MGIKDFICGNCLHKSNDTKLAIAIKQSLKTGGKKAWVGEYTTSDGVYYDIYLTMEKSKGEKNGQQT